MAAVIGGTIGDWTLATPDVVATQPVPAATTFVWDPVTDNLLAIFPEGASHTNAQPLRQFIHGGMGMDDPIEIVTADARLFPIFDEAGAGNLQAVVGENGQLLARGLSGDVYSEQQYSITAPAIDEVKLKATKDSTGSLTQVVVTMHATEPLDGTTIVSGTRLAAVAANGTLVRASTAAPTQPDPSTIAWTLNASDWTALTTNAAAFSIAATTSLRSTTYGVDIPILSATPDIEASGNVFSTTALPIEIREPIGTIQTRFATTGADTPFTLATLTSIGTTSGGIAGTLMVSPFQALPFVEPMTELVNARNRWYEPRTGNFLSPDPAGNIDSANLYAFAGSDPVNGRDPIGLLCETSNASGVWNWLQRCSQDALSVQQQFNRGIFSLKTPGRAVAGVVGTAKVIGKTVVGVSAMVIDQQLADSGDVNAMMRQGQRAMAIASAARHPLDTVVDAHARAADNILTAEQSGHWFRASIEAGEVGSADAAAVVGAVEGGVGLARLGGRTAARLSVAPSAVGVETADTIAEGLRLSPYRVTAPGETFIRYESANPAFTRITPSGGVTPGTFAAPASDGIIPLADRVPVYNLPSPRIPRPNVTILTPPPGTPVIGPRPVVGGAGNEVIFPMGYWP